VAGLVFATVPGNAQTTPPDLTVCDGVNCDSLQSSICSAAGFKITLTSFTPPNTNNNGSATYTYQICSPALGVCNGTVRNGESCSDNNFCKKKGQDEDPTATCSRECATDDFHGLSHFDIAFPELGNSCLSETTEVSGSCACASGPCSVGGFVLGDGSCFGPTSPVAKCDNTNLGPGGCLTMTLTIAGELTGLGLGAAVVVDKESTTCTASCLAGPSCDPCAPPPPEGECLTRTRGFWGTHPHVAAQYDPVTVCGKVIDGQAAGTCSTSEGLCTSSLDYKQNPQYLELVAQLTAAKLNLNATAALFEGATCSGFTFDGKSIQEIIAACEANYCNASKQAISGSGCIEVLDAFNNSEDTGFDQTPAPFDHPGPAQPAQCSASRGNGKAIGKNLCL
jgi:hypothetical protein